MDQSARENDDNVIDGLDALFDAAGAWRPGDTPRDGADASLPGAPGRAASAAVEPLPGKDAEGTGKRKKPGATRSVTPKTDDGASVIPEEDILAMTGGNEDGKFIAVAPGRSNTSAPVLIPAKVYTYIPLWGWATIVLGLIVFIAAAILLPGISIDRLTSRLGDDSDAVAQRAMRALVVKGGERTVRKLFDMAASEGEGIKARLRAVDTMSMIEDVPEVDRSLLRLELTEGTHDQVREAAIAARRQREALSSSRTREQR